MEANQHIVNIVKDGLKLQFHSKPPLSTPIVKESYQGDPERTLALRNAIQEMKLKGVLEPVENPSSLGFYGRLFVRKKPNLKWRVIIDLSELNEFILNDSFLMESPLSIQSSIRKQMWLPVST